MKEFLARLNPTERRFVVGVVVVFFLVINLVWVWPHFGDWSETKTRMDAASGKVVLFQGGTNLIPGLEKEIARYRGQGQLVPSADQAVQFVRLIQNQTAQFGIVPDSMTPLRQVSSTNNPFFVEQGENITMQSSEKQLVDFLYSLGAGTNSLIRVRALSVQPDGSHQKLTTRVTLVASYQKKAVGPTPAGAGAAKAPATNQKPAGTPTPTTTPAKTPVLPAKTPTTPAPSPGQVPRPFTATNRPMPNAPGAVKNSTPIKK